MIKNIQIDPLSVVPLSVECTIGQSSFSGTGFIVTHNSINYLITNWHMVTGRNPDTGQPISKTGAADPTTLNIWFHTAGQLGSWVLKTENLLDPKTGDKKWIEHPNGRQVDVVALPISNYTDISIYPFDRNLASTDLTLQRHITWQLQCSQFPFSMREIGPMVLHLYP